MAEGGLDEVPHGQVDVGVRGDEDRVLAAGLAEQIDGGLPRREQPGRVERAGEYDGVHSLVGHEAPAALVVAGGHELQDVARHSPFPEALDQLPGGGDRLGRRLQDDRVARRQSGADAAARNGVREVPWGDDEHDAERLGLSEILGLGRVEAREVDGLAHLGVGLGDGLGAVARHDRDGPRALALHDPRRPMEDLAPVQARQPGPRGRAGPRARHGRVDLLLGGDRVAVPRGAVAARIPARLELLAGDLVVVDDQRYLVADRGHHLSERLGHLVGVERVRGIAVGAVLEATAAVRTTRRVAPRRRDDVVTSLDGVEEALLLVGEDLGVIGDVEGGLQVVLVGRVLVEAAHEVGHGGGEVVVLGDRRVQQHGAAALDDGQRLGVGHAFEHLDVELVLDAALTRDLERPREVKEVVAGDPDAHRAGVLGAQAEIQEAHVAGVDVGLRAVGGGRPAVELRLGLLHREVGALHQADLDLCAASLVTDLRPGHELLERPVRVGQVGLEHDARGDPLELRLVQHRAEAVDGEAQVPVLLHVQVDEDIVALGPSVEHSELLAHPRQRTLVVDGDDLAHERGELHRDVGHLLARHHLEHPLEAFVGLTLAEHRLAEHVDVQPQPLALADVQVPAQRAVFSGEDEVLGQCADPGVDHLHRERGSRARHQRDETQSEGVERAESRDAGPSRRASKDARGAARLAHPHDLVGQGHRHLDRAAILQQPREPAPVGPFAMGPQALRVVNEPSGARARREGQLVEGAVGAGRHASRAVLAESALEPLPLNALTVTSLHNTRFPPGCGDPAHEGLDKRWAVARSVPDERTANQAAPYETVMPPSMARSAPVTAEDPAEHTHTIAAAISIGSSRRPMGCWAANSSPLARP